MRGVLLLGLDHRKKNVEVVQQFQSPGEKTGMCMKLNLSLKNDQMVIWSGYESGKLVAFSAETILEFDLPAGIKPFPLTAIGVDSNSNRGVVGGAEVEVIPFEIEGKNKVKFAEKTHQIPQKGINGVKFRFDSKVFATAGWDGKVRFFAAKKNPRLVCVCDFHSDPINCISFKPNSKIIASGSNDGRISLWNVL
jgi:WD40 repeat protein